MRRLFTGAAVFGSSGAPWVGFSSAWGMCFLLLTGSRTSVGPRSASSSSSSNLKASHRGHLAVAQRVRDQLNRAHNELPIDVQPCLDQVLEWLGTSAHRVAPGRVATVVDTARRYAGKFDQPPTSAADTAGPRQPPHHFASQENYFPVFESNTRDLQTLEARVVINITEFYTYMKAFRDYLRSSI